MPLPQLPHVTAKEESKVPPLLEADDLCAILSVGLLYVSHHQPS